MQRRRALMALALSLPMTGLATVAAHAADKVPCEAFARLGDGSWQALQTTPIPGHDFRVQEGSLWRPGQVVLGIDVAAMLEASCPNAPVASPQGAGASGTPGAAAQSQQPQAPVASLSRYADANGNLDVRTLTCGHLDDASPEEADLLLSWYSGWYNASGKGHGINMPRLRYAVRSVVDYCKTNRDKSLVKVMELMLK